MLVLSRRKNETIVIDGQIEIEVLKVKGNMVRLGIKAPQSVKILRGELAPFGKESMESPEVDCKEVTEFMLDIPTEGSTLPIAEAGLLNAAALVAHAG